MKDRNADIIFDTGARAILAKMKTAAIVLLLASMLSPVFAQVSAVSTRNAKASREAEQELQAQVAQQRNLTGTYVTEYRQEGERFSSVTASGDIVEQQEERSLFMLDFTGLTGDAKEWFENSNFSLQKEMSLSGKINVQFRDGALRTRTESPAFGLAINEAIQIEDYTHLLIVWGVDEFPVGASYEKRVNNEAIMLFVYFGDEKLSSGSIFTPNAPYFLGFFLSDVDTAGKAYKGRHFTKGGRFVCVGNPEIGEVITSELDLRAQFKQHFQKTPPSHISGISIVVDTSYVRPGKSAAFIKKIEFINKQ